MKPALFHQQAVDFQRQTKQLGGTIALHPMSWTFLAWGAIVTVAALCVFASVAPYARKQTVVGYLRPVGGTAKVFARRDGVVQQVFVHQGQVVKKDQPLLTVVTDGKNLQQEILVSLDSRRTGLLSQINAQRTRTAIEQRRLVDAIQSKKSEMVTLRTRVLSQQERVKLSEDLVRVSAILHQEGYMSTVDLVRRQSDELEHQQDLEVLIQQIIKVGSETSALDSQLAQSPATTEAALQVLQGELAAIDERIAQAKGKQSYTVGAPLDGKVAFSTASVGQAVDPKQPEMEILPTGVALQAELFIPSRAIGFVAPGKPVRLMYDAFPYQTFGSYGGTLLSVSQTMLTGNEPRGPLTLGYPAYTAVVTVDHASIDADGRVVPLQPDMTLKADIILEKRSVARMLLEPLLRTRF